MDRRNYACEEYNVLPFGHVLLALTNFITFCEQEVMQIKRFGKVYP